MDGMNASINSGSVINGVRVPPQWRWGVIIGGGVLLAWLGAFAMSLTEIPIIGALIGLAFAVWASRGRLRAWPKIWLMATVIVFLTPVLVFVGGVIYTGKSSESGLETAAGLIASGVAAALIGFVSVILGFLFMIVTIFTFKDAKEREQHLRAAGVDVLSWTFSPHARTVGASWNAPSERMSPPLCSAVDSQSGFQCRLSSGHVGPHR